MNVHIERRQSFDFGAYSSRVVSKSRNYELQGVAENCNYVSFSLDNSLPFGSLMPGRQYAGSQYRYGFNGKEVDGEVNGSGASYDYGFRIYDPRLGRFLSFDPLAPKYPYYTPYQFAGNMPVWAIDLDGLEPKRKGSAEGEAGTVVHGSSREEAEPLKDDYIWHAGTEDNNFEDARWMTPKEYDQNIFLLTRSRSEIVENNEHFIPWAISDHKFIPASSDELGLDLDGASSRFCESYEKACMALRNPKERSQGVEDVYLEVLLALESGYGVGKGIFKLGRWGVKLFSKGAPEAIIQLSKTRFGHTFTTHGEDASNFLFNRARGSGMPQGQFLDNQKAARFILDNLDETKRGAFSVPVPKGFPARVIMPNGTTKAATHIRIVPKTKGVKTAYPLVP